VKAEVVRAQKDMNRRFDSSYLKYLVHRTKQTIPER